MKFNTQSGRVIANNRRNERHGMTDSPEFKAWQNLCQRMTNPRNPDYKHYAGRGLTAHPLILRSFKFFLSVVGLRPGPGYSLERPNNNEGYVPGNMKWVPTKEQNANRRNTHLITYAKIADTPTGWARRLEISGSTIRNRLKEMSIEDVVFSVFPDARNIKAKSVWETLLEVHLAA